MGSPHANPAFVSNTVDCNNQSSHTYVATVYNQ